MLEPLLFSLTVAFLATSITMPLALVLATVMHDSRWRFLEFPILLPLFLPPTVSGFFLLWVLSPRHLFGRSLEGLWGRIVFTPTATVIACCLVSLPLAVQVFMVGLSRLESSLLESARTLGGQALFNTVRVKWPLLWPAFGIGTLLVFARCLGEFGASFMVGGNVEAYTQTLPIAIYSHAQSGEYTSAAVASGLAILTGLTVYLVLRNLYRRS